MTQMFLHLKIAQNWQKCHKNILYDLGKELQQSGDINNQKKYLGSEKSKQISYAQINNLPLKKLGASGSTTEIKWNPKLVAFKFDTSVESMSLNPNTYFSVKPGTPL